MTRHTYYKDETYVNQKESTSPMDTCLVWETPDISETYRRTYCSGNHPETGGKLRAIISLHDR